MIVLAFVFQRTPVADRKIGKRGIPGRCSDWYISQFQASCFSCPGFRRGRPVQREPAPGWRSGEGLVDSEMGGWGHWSCV